MKNTFNNLKRCSQALTIRCPRERDSGPAKLYIPGVNFLPFSNTARMILGSISAKTPIDLVNLYSKSDSYSEDTSRFFADNPPLPSDVIAYLISKNGNQSLIEQSETVSGQIIGLISNDDFKNHEIFDEAKERRLKAYVLQNSKLFERNPDNSFSPAKFSSEVISFDKASLSEDELKEQQKYLEKCYQNYIKTQNVLPKILLTNHACKDPQIPLNNPETPAAESPSTSPDPEDIIIHLSKRSIYNDWNQGGPD